MFDNWYFASYFANWIIFLLVSFVEVISYSVAWETSDPGFMAFWSDKVGYFGSVVGMAVPWAFLVAYMYEFKDWSNMDGMIFFRVVGDGIVHIVNGTLHYLFLPRLLAWAEAT